MEKRIKMVCSKCGSENVVKDAFAEWNIDKQEWVLHSVYDFTSCNDCGEEDCVDEVEIEDGDVLYPVNDSEE